MNFVERKNMLFRLIGTFLLLCSVGLTVFSTITIIKGNSEDKMLSVVTCCLAICFAIFEAIIVIKGWKKELSLYKIAFDDTGRVNSVGLIAIIIGSVIGLALSITSLVLYCTHQYEPFLTSCLVILSIGIYLMVNCIIYFIFLFMYKKRELDILKYTK